MDITLHYRLELKTKVLNIFTQHFSVLQLIQAPTNKSLELIPALLFQFQLLPTQFPTVDCCTEFIAPQPGDC